jgi:hypothetical protein
VADNGRQVALQIDALMEIPMKTSKPWTNETFTKRVDHEAGRHRPPRTPRGARVCQHCGAVYEKRRWVAAASTRSASLRALAAPALTICPACRMIADQRFGGEVRISGGYVPAHRAAIERLVRNEAARAAEDNPTAAIVSLDRPAPRRLVVRTTTEHLAQRIGHALHKAMHGQVRYRFSHENKFAHVTWTRDE